jgi:multidrug resistance efflux pump
MAIVPDVAGEVTEVPVSPNKPLKAGDVLFKIDPTPYQAQVDTIGAQLKFEELRLAQMSSSSATQDARSTSSSGRRTSTS